MKCVIVLNGEYCDNYVFPKDRFVIACDGAYEELKKRNVKIDCVLGDFDSLGFIPDGAEIFPAEKDMTDGEIGLSKALELGFKNVDIISFGGKREDHLLGNLSLLIKAANNGVSATAYTNNSVIRYLKSGIHEFSFALNSTVSLFTFGSCFIKSSKGLKYPYNDLEISRDCTRGISNVVISDKVVLEISTGDVFLFENII